MPAIGGHESHQVQTNEWLTPRYLLEALGPFDLDPCASDRRPFDTAARSITREEDGLAQEWAGRVWLNPPYSTVSSWMERLARHDCGTALVFARTDTRWWHEHVWPRAAGILFVRGRITFVRADGRPHDKTRGSGNAGAASAFIAYGARDLELLAASKIDGALVTLGHT